jgi:hypothetical protein
MFALKHCSPSLLHSARQQHRRPAAAQRAFQPVYRKRRTVTRAQIGDMFDTVVTWGSVAAGVGAVVYSIFYDWKETSQQQRQQQEAAMFGPADNTTWAVMGVVSCIPFFNYLVSAFEDACTCIPAAMHTHQYWCAAAACRTVLALTPADPDRQALKQLSHMYTAELPQLCAPLPLSTRELYSAKACMHACMHMQTATARNCVLVSSQALSCCCCCSCCCCHSCCRHRALHKAP